MASEDRKSEDFTESQRAQIEGRRLDQDRTLLAMHELEAALDAAAPTREAPWHDAVLGALSVLGEATGEEAANDVRPDSLLSDIAFILPDPPPEGCPGWWLDADDSPRHIVPVPSLPDGPQIAPGRDSLGRPFAGKTPPTPEQAFKAAEGKRGFWR